MIELDDIEIKPVQGYGAWLWHRWSKGLHCPDGHKAKLLKVVEEHLGRLQINSSIFHHIMVIDGEIFRCIGNERNSESKMQLYFDVWMERKWTVINVSASLFARHNIARDDYSI